MNDSSSRGVLLVVAGALVQCFFYGLYTALFLLSATFTSFSRRPHRWTLLPLNTTIYLISTATLFYDLVMACVSVETLNTVRLYRLAQGGDPKFVRIRNTLFIAILTLTESLVIWRLSRIWLKARYLAVVASFLHVGVAGSGLVLVHIQAKSDLRFRYDVYRRTAFSFFACLMTIILGRFFWMSRHVRKLYGPHIRAYTIAGSCVDSGMLFIVFYGLDLALASRDIPIFRPALPQFAGMMATLILFQESLGRSAQDLDVTVRTIEEAGDGHSTPVLDTLFSTPGVSMQSTVGQGGRSITGPRPGLDGSFLGSRSMFSIRSRSQLAVGDDGPGEEHKSRLSVDNVGEDIRQPEKVHG